MCPLSPPPAAVFLAWPWQAPLNWLGFGAIAAAWIWRAIRYQRTVVHRESTTARQHRQKRLWVQTGALTCLFMSLALSMLVTEPSIQANDAWENGQLLCFENQDCTFTPLFTISSAHVRAISVASRTAFGLMVLGLLLLSITNLTARRDG
jgi:hypothetical protein